MSVCARLQAAAMQLQRPTGSAYTISGLAHALLRSQCVQADPDLIERLSRTDPRYPWVYPTKTISRGGRPFGRFSVRATLREKAAFSEQALQQDLPMTTLLRVWIETFTVELEDTDSDA
jgi:hypothetical protein